jgi:membrane protease YdiL (CAAX protease family)
MLILARNKEFLVTSLVVMVSILFLGYFKESSQISPALQGLIVAVAVFLVIPLLYCKIVLEQPLSRLGFQRGNPWAGIGGSVLALGIALSALFVLWNFTPLLEGYRLPVAVEEQFLFFVLYEVLLNGLFLFLFEVFFRGMILLLWLKDFRIWGVFLQALVFTGILYLSGDMSNGINPQTLPMLLFAPFAGLIAYQSRSIWYSFGASWFFILLVDALVLILR